MACKRPNSPFMHCKPDIYRNGSGVHLMAGKLVPIRQTLGNYIDSQFYQGGCLFGIIPGWILRSGINGVPFFWFYLQHLW